MRRDLEKEVVGKKIKTVEVDGHAVGPPAQATRRSSSALLEGRKIVAVAAAGKYLVLRLDGPEALIVHLGMSGQLLRAKSAREKAPKHTHVVITFTQGGLMRFVDPRTFGEMFVTEYDEHRRAGRGARAPRPRSARDRAVVGPVRPHARRAESEAEAAADGPEVHRRHRQRLQRRDPLPGGAVGAPSDSCRSKSRASTAISETLRRGEVPRSSLADERTSTCSEARRVPAPSPGVRPRRRGVQSLPAPSPGPFSNRSTFYCEACQV